MVLPNGIPSADTFRRLFERLSPQQFEYCFEQWVKLLVEDGSVNLIAIDGKGVKGSYDRSAGRKALPLVSAWASEHRLVFAQTKVQAQSNEMTAVPALLELLDLKGELCFKLFSRSFGFPNNDKNAVIRRCVKSEKSAEDPLKITLKDISSGSYALAVFQDLNGDRKLNRDTTGIPTEGCGFSNNPHTHQDLTRYGDCVFLLAGATETINIKMKYPPAK